MSFREPNGAVVTNMKPPQEGEKTRGPRRSAAYRAAPRQGSTVKQLKDEVSAVWPEGAGCRKIFLAFRQGKVFFT